MNNYARKYLIAPALFSDILDFITRRVLIVMPVLYIVFIYIGTNKEHGDINAGSMYGFALFPSIPILVICYIIYVLFDRLIKNTLLNIFKNISHFILALSTCFFKATRYSEFIWTTLITVTVVNMVIYLLVKFSFKEKDLLL